MYLRKLKLTNFKNLDEKQFDLCEKMNCFVGKNGVGKTNILDAVYFLCFTKSYFNITQNQAIRHGEDFFTIEGIFYKDIEEQIFISCERGGVKKIKRQGKEIDKISDYIGTYPLVIVSPTDTDLILEGSSVRRKFIDGLISQTDRMYLADIINYKKLLSERNFLLKKHKEANIELEIFQEKMTFLGQKIFDKRRKFIKMIVDVFKPMYEKISGSKESVSIDYKSIFENQMALKQALEDAKTKDVLLGHCSVGIHKDDLVFKINDFPINKFGSQGQQKSFLTSLKLAQFQLIKNITQIKPLLLLDDIFDKLDNDRVKYIIDLVNSDNFGQIFISDTHIQRIEELTKNVLSDSRIFKI